jgi:protein-disulfide isomerase
MIAATFLIVGIVVGIVLANSSNATNKTLIEQSVAAAMDAQADLIAASRGPSLDDPNSRFTVSADDDPFLGPEDAPVVVVEFSDFNCTFCKRFASTTLQPLIDAYGDRVRFTYRDYPILAESSLTAALAAQCVNDQGQDKFWEYHNLLFSHQDGFSRESLITLAEQVGVDIDTFTTCLDEQTHLNEVVNDYREGQMLGIRGTPAFFVNGRPISGAQQYQVFASMIEEELETAQQNTENNTSEAS